MVARAGGKLRRRNARRLAKTPVRQAERRKALLIGALGHGPAVEASDVAWTFGFDAPLLDAFGARPYDYGPTRELVEPSATRSGKRTTYSRSRAQRGIEASSGEVAGPVRPLI